MRSDWRFLDGWDSTGDWNAPATLLLFMLVVPCAAEAQRAPRAYPEVTIPNTELRSLHSSVTGRDYDLYVYLPSRLERSSGRKYPVLYLLDWQWDFKLLASILRQPFFWT